MAKIRKENEMIEIVQKSATVVWSRPICVRLLTAAAVVSIILSVTVQVIDFGQAEGEAIECYEGFREILDQRNVTVPTGPLLDLCRKDTVLEWMKLVGSITAVGFMAIKGYGDEKREKESKEKDEIFNKLQGRQQVELFEEFIRKLDEFQKHRDRSHFRDCINMMRGLIDKENFFLPRLGPPELITSFLFQHIEDTGINKILTDAKESAGRRSHRRRKHRKHGEGAAQPLQLERSFDAIWSDIEKEAGTKLNWLKIGDQYVCRNGNLCDGKEGLPEQPAQNERVVIDLTDHMKV